jgi:hypothetical protein
MYVNRLMRPVETIPGRGEGEGERGCEFNYYVFDIL